MSKALQLPSALRCQKGSDLRDVDQLTVLRLPVCMYNSRCKEWLGPRPRDRKSDTAKSQDDWSERHTTSNLEKAEEP